MYKSHKPSLVSLIDPTLNLIIGTGSALDPPPPSPRASAPPCNIISHSFKLKFYAAIVCNHIEVDILLPFHSFLECSSIDPNIHKTAHYTQRLWCQYEYMFLKM
jgi:hypothetical protein